MQNADLWRGLKPEIASQLRLRDYSCPSPAERLSLEGMDASAALAGKSALVEAGAWIPGVELISRQVFGQRQRGLFGELGRMGQGRLGEIGLWPKQWAAARMFAGSAKGFHIHPPHVPPDETPEKWFARLFSEPDENIGLRPYDREQWDVMYFLQGRLEVILADERAGLPRRCMWLLFDGDDHRGANNLAVVIPPGVAHALRAEGSHDVVMVYGTTTVFHADFEGRIANFVESATLQPEWLDYLGRASR